MLNQFKLSVSGIRAVVDVALNEGELSRYIQSFISVIHQLHNKISDVVAVAADTRPSSLRWKQIALDTLICCGYSVVDLGVITTPCLLFSVRHFNLIGGVMITASHNPIEWNGLKFVDRGGLLFNQQQMNHVEQIFCTDAFSYPAILADAKQIDHPNSKQVMQLHVNHVLDVMGLELVNRIRNRRFKVAFDPVNGCACDMAKYFLDSLHCECYGIHEMPSSHFGRSPEPTANNIIDLQCLVRQQQCDVGFAFDPDGDRLTLVSNLGCPVGEEYTLVLAVDEYLHQYSGDVVVNLSSSRMIDEVVQRHSARIIRTAVGEANVIKEMLINTNQPIGGEGCGGIIWPKIVQGRDSLSAMALILSGLIRINKPLSQWINDFPRYSFLKSSITMPEDLSVTHELINYLKDEYRYYHSCYLDGIRVDTTHFWFHVRCSNTEPILRIFVEAETLLLAQEQMQILKQQCNDYLN